MAPENVREFGFENAYWDILDSVKDLFTADRWQSILMDCSKNELLALVHVYREGETTMSRLAEYVDVPLNTATGVANRLERRGLVERWRSEQDKRVVSVRITEEGKEQVSSVIENVGTLISGLFENLSADEQQLLIKVIARLPELFAREVAASKNDEGKRGSAKDLRRIAIE